MIENKICQSCGRSIEPRKKWIKNWSEIKYCSDSCRKMKSQKNENYEEAILDLLKRRGAGRTICPSEILPDSEKSNPEIMQAVRSSARLLVAKKLIVITQKGQVVDPSFAKGPIRLKLL